MANNKFIKGLSEKTSILDDDLLIMQPDAEESTAYKIKKSNVVLPQVEYNTWYISKSGSDSNAGTSAATPFITMAKAIASSTVGDRIHFLDSNVSYDEVLTIDKRLIFTGNTNNANFQGFENDVSLRGTWTITDDNVVFENLTVRATIVLSVARPITFNNCYLWPTLPTRLTKVSMYDSLFISAAGRDMYSLVANNSRIISTGGINVGQNVELYGTTCDCAIVAGLDSSATCVMKNSTITGALTITGDLETENSTVGGTRTVSGTISEITQGQKGESGSFTTSIKADAQVYFPDYTQTGTISFTKDASVIDDEGYGNGIHGIIISNGDPINFTDDFDVSIPILLTSGLRYQFTAVWRGQKFSAAIVETGQWTPLTLGSKLINWYDGQIVDVTGTAVNNWIDQKGTIDFANNGNKATYDSANNLIVFNSTNSEALESDSNASSYNRSSGEWWAVIDYVSGNDMRIINLSDASSLTDVFYIRVSATGQLSVIINTGSNISFLSTTLYSTGKLIIRISQNGSALKVLVNDTDITSENASATPITTEWESTITPANVRIAQLIRSSGSSYSDLRINALLRTAVLTDGEQNSMYNYLNVTY